MKRTKALLFGLALAPLFTGIVMASDGWQQEQSPNWRFGQGHTSGMEEYRDSPFYAPERATVEHRNLRPYSTQNRALGVDEEVAIMRTSMTNLHTIKTTYDRKGNIITIHSWDRRTGEDVPVNLDVLADPITKDEIESSVAKLRVVYNSYGEVVSRQAWNKITGEKISVPPAIPFTNFIDEDKYWAWVERQKLYERSYADMYVDRGAVRTRRMKSMMQYANPFGVPYEVEVYEERPIVERHYDDGWYRNDVWIAMFSADMTAKVKDRLGASSGVKKKSASHFEVGADVELGHKRFDLTYHSIASDSTLNQGLTFDNRAYGAGSMLDFDLQAVDVAYRRPFVRSDKGDFALNWILSARLMDLEAKLSNQNLGGTNISRLKGTTVMPLIGMETIKNVSDHIDFFGSYRMFDISDVAMNEWQIGAKYYFHPEQVDDWRAVVGLKSLTYEGEESKDFMRISQRGMRFGLEKAF